MEKWENGDRRRPCLESTEPSRPANLINEGFFTDISALAVLHTLPCAHACSPSCHIHVHLCSPRLQSIIAAAPTGLQGWFCWGRGDTGMSCYPPCDPRCDPPVPSVWQQSLGSPAAVTSLAEHRPPHTNPVSSGRFCQSPCRHQDESLGIWSHFYRKSVCFSAGGWVLGGCFQCWRGRVMLLCHQNWPGCACALCSPGQGDR